MEALLTSIGLFLTCFVIVVVPVALILFASSRHKAGLYKQVKVRQFKLGFKIYGPDDPRFAEMKRR